MSEQIAVIALIIFGGLGIIFNLVAKSAELNLKKSLLKKTIIYYTEVSEVFRELSWSMYYALIAIIILSL